MARRTPFYAFLTKIASEGKSCPSGSTMVAGKCTPTPVSPSESKTISLTKTPTRLGSSIQSTKVTIGTIVPEKIKTPVVAVKPKTESAVLGVSSEATPMKSQIAAIREKLVIGATGSSASSTTSAGKAITTPTISLARPEEGITPNTANPNKLPVTEETLAGGISATPEEPVVSESTGFIFRGVPIKM